MSQSTILIVDDTPQNLDVLYAMLTQQGYAIRAAVTGKMALESARQNPPDLILLDILMPDSNGYKVCEALKSDPITQAIPVIFLSALDEPLDKVRAFRVGGVDYITKPLQVDEVLARVANHLALYHKQREVERLREQDRLYFEKLSALKDEVLRTASHDLKNPLNIIMGAVFLLEKHGRVDDERGKHHLKQIERGAHRMLTLITDLLDLAKIETGLDLQPTATNLNEFLATLHADFSLAAQDKGQTLHLVIPKTTVMVSLDVNRMTQVLSNLLSNALKYTPEGGQIWLELEPTPTQTLIRVRDTGLGIPASDLEQIFDKFHRVQTAEHLKIEGTGLGLSIVKAIVEQHGGKIYAQSQLGQGSTFIIELPLLNSI